MAKLIDSIATASYDSTSEPLILNTGVYPWIVGMAITLPVGAYISSVKFYCFKTNSPVGSAYAKIYNVSGAVGSTAKPSGAAIATSDAVDVSTLSAQPTMELKEFTFSGDQKIYVPAGDIGIACSFQGDLSNYPQLANCAAGTHSGNKFKYDDSAWAADAAKDIIFELYGEDKRKILTIL